MAADKRTPNAGTSSVRYEQTQFVRPNRELPQKEVKVGKIEFLLEDYIDS